MECFIECGIFREERRLHGLQGVQAGWLAFSYDRGRASAERGKYIEYLDTVQCLFDYGNLVILRGIKNPFMQFKFLIHICICVFF